LAVPIIAHGATIGSITIRVLDERLDATVFTQRALEVLASTAGAIANGITRMNYELNTMSTSSVMSTAQALRPRKQLHRKSKVALDSKVVAQNG
jgi:hypothetical protein